MENKFRPNPYPLIPLADLIGDVTPGYVTMEVIDPPKRSAGVKVDSVDALVAELKGKGLV